MADRRPLPLHRLRDRPLHQARPGRRRGRDARPRSRPGPATGSAPTLLTADGIATLPPRAGAAHARALLDAIGRHAPTPAPTATARPSARARRRRCPRPRSPAAPAAAALVVVVSDFPGTAGWVAGAALGRRPPRDAGDRGARPPRARPARRRPARGVRSRDRARQREVRTGDAGLRRRYAEAARAPPATTAATLRAHAVDHLVLRTDRDGPPTWRAGSPVVATAGAQRRSPRRHRARGTASEVSGEVPRRMAAVPARRRRRHGGRLGGRGAPAPARRRAVHQRRAARRRSPPREPGWRRHVPAALFLAALTLLVVGFAQPVRDVQVRRRARDRGARHRHVAVDGGRRRATRPASRWPRRPPATFVEPTSPTSSTSGW